MRFSKILCLFMVVTASCLAFSVSKPTTFAEDTAYMVECSDEENLATNKNNWHMPTISMAEFTVDENEGMKFDNIIKSQLCSTYFRGDNLSEFKLSLLVNANLTIPPENKAEWRYSEFFITFLIDRQPEDAIAEDSIPWQANKVYGSFCFGLTSGGLPISRFMYYNAFASNCQQSGQFYQPAGGYTDTNIVDGKDHWVEIEIKNYSNETETGSKWTAYIDGVKVAEFDRADDYYYDTDSRRDYEVNYSELSGGIGFYANSDWPGGYSPSKMNNFLTIKKAKLISYDENPAGTVVGQCSAPEYKVTSKEYAVAASYDAGDPIEIQLTDLFDYAGTDIIAYEVLCNGQPIGEITNGFWSWTPTAAGTYDIDFKATLTDENKAVNYLTIRVVGDNGQSSNGGNENSGNGSGSGGCNGSVSGVGVCSALMLLGVAFLKKRR